MTVDTGIHQAEEDNSDVSPEWIEELHRRTRNVEIGSAKLIPGEELWKTINERFGTSF